MAVVALILGVLGGLLGLAVALETDIAAIGETIRVPALADVRLDVIRVVAGPIATILGGIVVKPKPMIGGALMLIGAIGMVLTFDLSAVNIVPIVCSATGAVLGVYAERKYPAPTPSMR